MNESDLVKTYFEREAVSFDRLYAGSLRDRILRPAVYRRTELALELTRRLGYPAVLDVGCGSARTAVALCDAGTPSVTGIDFSSTMVALGREVVAASRHDPRIELQQADFFTWDPGRTWPLVLALGVLEYFADARVAIGHLGRVTGEHLAFSVRRFTLLRGTVRALRYRLAGCPIYFASPATIRAACEDAGFRHVHIDDGGPGSYWVHARR